MPTINGVTEEAVLGYMLRKELPRVAPGDLHRLYTAQELWEAALHGVPASMKQDVTGYVSSVQKLIEDNTPPDKIRADMKLTPEQVAMVRAVPRKVQADPLEEAIAKPVPVKVKTLPHYEGLPLPQYMTDGAAGMDAYAAVRHEWPVVIRPGETRNIRLGICVAIPPGYEIQFRSRSGLAAKHGVHVLNSPGTVDSDYRGEMHAILHNSGSEPYSVKRGDRVGQMVIAPVTRMELIEVEELDQTARGEGGFGSTGM